MTRRGDPTPPAHWQDFEDLCLKLWRPRLDDAKKHGRTGQPQAGVDIFGRDPKTGTWVGIQCKQKGQWPPKVLTIRQIKDEVRMAARFKPPLSHFIIATTAQRNAKCQEFVRRLGYWRRKGGNFSVDLYAWDDLQDWLHNGPVSGLPVIRPATRDFTGRTEELEELRQTVSEHAGAMIYGVRGLGGIGKTQVGLKLVEVVGTDYPDGHILVELGGASDHPLSSVDAMAQVIRAYQPQAGLPEAEADLRRLYHQVLKDRRAIVFLDDAAGAQQVEPLLPHSRCLTLVTSRKRFALPKLHRLDLDALTPDAAQELLLSLAPRLGAEAEDIAEVLGRLPLALRLAGSAFAERPELEPDEYFQKLESRDERLGLVEAAISINYEALVAEHQRLWRALAVFPGDFDVAGAAAVWAMALDAARDVLGGALYAVSLVEWRAGRYRLHDLARDFAASRLEESERHPAALRHAGHYVEVLWNANRLYKEGGQKMLEGLALFDREWGNIQAGQSWAIEHDGAVEYCNSYAYVGVYCLSLRLRPVDRIAWLKAGLSAAAALGDRGSEATHLGNLSSAYIEVGEMEEAIGCCEQALEIDREIGDRRGEGSDICNLGNCYDIIGKSATSIGCYEEALAISHEIEDKRLESNALCNLGTAYRSLGEVDESISSYTTALEIARAVGDRGVEIKVLRGLGTVFAGIGKLEKSIEFLEGMVTLAREIGHRSEEGNGLGNMGLVCAALGEVERATTLLRKALEIGREIGDQQIIRLSLEQLDQLRES